MRKVRAAGCSQKQMDSLAAEKVPLWGLIMAPELGQPSWLRSPGWSAATVCSTCAPCIASCLNVLVPMAVEAQKGKLQTITKEKTHCGFSLLLKCARTAIILPVQ